VASGSRGPVASRSRGGVWLEAPGAGRVWMRVWAGTAMGTTVGALWP
jgi:hypothetical protein